ncbi:MAG: hypothetical protein EZS28_021813 [Streblomastix strix]|uniref:Protein YIF1 n=1 Tax=Streblomastix strix TaxID=222440 RepID=A0A5J4VJC7_9EUKA|nr:MAG: hypothetical protein EZS28_021813 [Streblomastix strix]
MKEILSMVLGAQQTIDDEKIKRYFDVTNSYVINKLGTIFFPFIKKHWRSNSNHPRDDANAIDLYIPFMGLFTYVLIVAYIQGKIGDFKPYQVLGTCLSLVVFGTLLEIAGTYLLMYVFGNSSQNQSAVTASPYAVSGGSSIKRGVHIDNSQYTGGVMTGPYAGIFDILGVSGLKFVGMTAGIVIVYLGGKIAGYAVLGYLAVSHAYMVLRAYMEVGSSSLENEENRNLKPHHALKKNIGATLVAAMQIPLMFIYVIYCSRSWKIKVKQ